MTSLVVYIVSATNANKSNCFSRLKKLKFASLFEQKNRQKQFAVCVLVSTSVMTNIFGVDCISVALRKHKNELNKSRTLNKIELLPICVCA